MTPSEHAGDSPPLDPDKETAPAGKQGLILKTTGNGNESGGHKNTKVVKVLTAARLAKNRNKAGPTPPNVEELWAKVDLSTTKWTACKYHGAVTRPEIRALDHLPGRLHLHLLCPECLGFLGFARQLRFFRNDDLETQRATYLRFLDEAKAKGWRPGNAYYRFKTRYGIEPDPDWYPAWMRHQMPEGVT